MPDSFRIVWFSYKLFFIFVSEKNKINFALCMNYRIFAKDKLRSADIQASLMFSAILQHKP